MNYWMIHEEIGKKTHIFKSKPYLKFTNHPDEIFHALEG